MLAATLVVMWLAGADIRAALAAGTPPIPKLFLEEDLSAQPQREPSLGPPAKRSRFARLHPDGLGLLAKGRDGGAGRLELNFFADVTAPTMIERVQCLDAERTVSIGRVEDLPGSQVIAARVGQAVAVSAFLPGHGTFQIQCVGAGQHRIAELQPADLPPCGVLAGAAPSGEEVEPLGVAAAEALPSRLDSAGEPAGSQFTAAPLADAPPAEAIWLLDLLVLHTEAARKAAGGSDGIEAVILAAVAEVNVAFENSGVPARVRLAGARDADYHETGQMSRDLAYLSNPDGDLREWRERAKADLVCMIVETSDGPYGTANYMDEVSTRFARQAFSVVQRRYANGLFILPHELGHNLGCQHDRQNATTLPPGSFNYGYRFALDGVTYRTVMAQPPGVPIAHYSNPDVHFQGVPTGVPEGQPDAANNARRLNQSVAVAAAFHSPAAWTRAPSVQLRRPAAGEVVGVTGQLDLQAEAVDSDGQIVQVEFFVNGQRVAQADQAPFVASWPAVAAGTYTVVARARRSRRPGLECRSGNPRRAARRQPRCFAPVGGPDVSPASRRRTGPGLCHRGFRQCDGLVAVAFGHLERAGTGFRRWPGASIRPPVLPRRAVALNGLHQEGGTASPEAIPHWAEGAAAAAATARPKPAVTSGASVSAEASVPSQSLRSWRGVPRRDPGSKQPP